ncbi:MAG: hypothetical protein A4E35_00411 [Methanoregula sp. PtaU1.Bin051]|nr:MAG: hypothetical protein A4E35_00411 [Methanoregula sp. PtaU1.Bin051]
MRGRKPDKTIEAAEKFAQRQGYRWVPNPDPAMPFTAIGYREHDLIVIRVKTCRRSMGEYDISEDFFREDYDILASLPFPEYTQRELWVRYAWSRKFIRYRILNEWLVEHTFKDQEPPVFTLKRTEKKPKIPTTPDSPGVGAGGGPSGGTTPK